MEASVPVALAPSQKRSLDDDAQPPISTPNKTAPSNVSTPLSILSSIQTPSPLKRVAIDSTAPASSNSSVAGDAPDPAQGTVGPSGTQQPAKRRKLTQQEKEEQQREKEEKAKARAEKKAQKELEDKLKAEQKAQKDEEKRARDEEKRKKNEEKEEKRRAKELEQQQKEEEKRKKERSQMKLNSFFVKPKPAGDASGNATVDSIQSSSTGQISLPPPPALTNTDSAPPSPQKAILRNAQSDYERCFLPFSLPAHAVLAPYNAFMEDSEKLAAAKARIDNLIAQKDVDVKPTALESITSLLPSCSRGLRTISIVEIVDQVNGSAAHPIDLTAHGSAKPQRPLDLLKQIPMKYLHFPEDVRPPYYGTYTKPHSSTEERRLARNPFSRALLDMDYDYDSEAEWVDEEGEDLGSDDEEDLEEEDDDMDGFLDDEEDLQAKRRLLNGDQDPLSTGLCWEDARGVSRLNDGSGAISTEFKEFKMGFLLEPQPQSIDPFSTAYWAPEPAPTTTTVPVSSTAMNPPRLPLTARPVNGLLNTLNTTQNQPPGSTAKAVKPKRQIPDEHLPAFKAEIEGKDFTKIGMIEALKKKFPKLPKDAITNSLTAVAARVGPSEKEKRWVLFNN